MGIAELSHSIAKRKPGLGETTPGLPRDQLTDNLCSLLPRLSQERTPVFPTSPLGRQGQRAVNRLFFLKGGAFQHDNHQGLTAAVQEEPPDSRRGGWGDLWYIIDLVAAEMSPSVLENICFR